MYIIHVKGSGISIPVHYHSVPWSQGDPHDTIINEYKDDIHYSRQKRNRNTNIVVKATHMKRIRGNEIIFGEGMGENSERTIK